MEDVIEKDPMAAYPPGQEDAPRVTGDKLIDSWERELAAGKTPDIAADLAGDAAVQAWLKPKKTGVPTEPPNLDPTELDFHDDFTGG